MEENGISKLLSMRLGTTQESWSSKHIMSIWHWCTNYTIKRGGYHFCYKKVI
jgi:hypothetical protein